MGEIKSSGNGISTAKQQVLVQLALLYLATWVLNGWRKKQFTMPRLTGLVYLPKGVTASQKDLRGSFASAVSNSDLPPPCQCVSVVFRSER